METVLVANTKGGVGKTVVAVTLAGALAKAGHRVALADADRQGSALGWLARRPKSAIKIRGIDWTGPDGIGEAPKKTDWLVIDAPGSLKDKRTAALVAEARAVLVPVQPSVFDIDATADFLTALEELKRVRKGKVGIHLVANRLRTNTRAVRDLERFCGEIGRYPVARLTERAAYGELAREGLSIFDRDVRALEALREQWAPVLDTLM